MSSLTPTNTVPPRNLEQELDSKLLDIQVQKTEDDAKALAKKLGLSYVNLKSVPISTSALLVLDEPRAKAGQMAVISLSVKKLKIAVLDPENPTTKEILAQLEKEGYSYTLVITSPLSLDRVWELYNVEKKSHQKEMGVASIKESEISELQKEIQDLSHLKERLAKMSVTQAINVLIAGALATDASDIHLEAEKDQVRLRYRIDGMLQDIVDIAKKDYPQILSRIKILSGLKINITDIPQDGRFTIRQENYEIEVRTSVLPGAYGEAVVMRLLDPRKIRQNLEDLGMREDTLETVKNLLKKTTGSIITTGPTGSGKTTTLYAFINQINSPDIKIITIENPIEYHIKGISQTQVDPDAGYTFANGLRSIVRQDPDVILVGEIRDIETADIAMQAALTGHMVFSTLHTNDAAGAIPRLIEFGVKPVTIAPAVNAAMAQRLVRRLCQSCKKKSPATAEDLALFEKHLSSLPSTIKVQSWNKDLELYYPQKCKDCNFTGYKDRVGVYEVLLVDPEIEKLIISSPSITDIRALALKKGMVTMLQDGLIKVLEGMTSTEEVLRVIGE